MNSRNVENAREVLSRIIFGGGVFGVNQNHTPHHHKNKKRRGRREPHKALNSPSTKERGGVLLSRGLPTEVPSPQPGLASRFGMETGRLPDAITAANLSLLTTRRLPGNQRKDAKK